MAIKDKDRTLEDSDMAKTIARGAAASGFLAGGVATAGAIGMLTPLAPVVVLGIASGVIGRLIKKSEEEKMHKAKELAYKQAIAKQNAIIKALKEESDADKERIEYLVGLNQLLQEAVKELQKELQQYQ